MIFEGNISVVLILLVTFCLAILILSYKIVWELIIPSIENRKFKNFFTKWTFRSQLFFWSIFIVYFLYRFFLSFPAFTLVVLILTLILGWSFWKDLISGLIIRIEGSLYIGDWLIFEKTKGQIIQLRNRNLLIELENKEKQIIWYHQLSLKQFSVIEGRFSDHFIIFNIKKSEVEKFGGIQELLNLIQSNPWNSVDQKISVLDEKDDCIRIKVWTLNADASQKLKKHLSSHLDLSD